MTRRLDIAVCRSSQSAIRAYRVLCPMFNEMTEVRVCRHCDYCAIIIDNQVRCRYERNHSH